MTAVRLNKLIAAQLVIGRRQVDELITQGEVLINGRPAVLGAQVNPQTDAITVRGKVLQLPQSTAYQYVLLDKPVGYVCSRRQQGDTPTIYALLPPAFQHLKPVGRLDKDTSGLLLLTNDGQLAHQLMHPSFQKVKIYEVTLDQPLQPLHHQMINDHGVQLTDGPSRLHLEPLKESDYRAWQVTMAEGRNRQIRRTFAALGYTVVRLRRIAFGAFSIHDLHGKRMQQISI